MIKRFVVWNVFFVEAPERPKVPHNPDESSNPILVPA
jgi:hypothetical protein